VKNTETIARKVNKLNFIVISIMREAHAKMTLDAANVTRSIA